MGTEMDLWCDGENEALQELIVHFQSSGTARERLSCFLVLFHRIDEEIMPAT